MTKKSDENRQTCSQKALVYLREQIINGNLLPQEKLVESELAGILGISRGPVRDALKQLAIEGLVDYQPNRGCTVALLSPMRCSFSGGVWKSWPSNVLAAI